MTLRSVLAGIAAAWCFLQALLLGDGREGTTGVPPDVEVIGDPAVMAVYVLGRIILVAIGLVALALVDWRRLRIAGPEVTVRGPHDA